MRITIEAEPEEIRKLLGLESVLNFGHEYSQYVQPITTRKPEEPSENIKKKVGRPKKSGSLVEKAIKLLDEEHNPKRAGKRPSVSLEDIREIKLMAQNKASDKMILERLKPRIPNLTLETVRYWRKNTPKELIM